MRAMRRGPLISTQMSATKRSGRQKTRSKMLSWRAPRTVSSSSAPEPIAGPSIMKEVELSASDPSGAVREAARLRWPPRAIGFRLIDGDGREVFGRDRR
jgi:hypothetical protein